MVKTVFKATKTKGALSHSVELKSGDFVFKEGDLGTEMYVIQLGRIALLKNFRGEEKQLGLLEKGDFFGETSVLESLPRTSSARVVEDCRLIEINGSNLEQMLRKNPEITVRMMRKLSQRLRQTDGLLRESLGSASVAVSEIAAPVNTPAPIPKATERLVHTETGREFVLSTGETTAIGRKDPVTGIDPDIDLTPADTQRSISRRHAMIFRRQNKYYIREEIGTMNGTFVNGERVETGIPVEFKDGDHVRFGLIKTIFHAN